MRKAVFFCATLLALFYLVVIIKNVFFDLENYSEFNFGVIAGKIILLIILALVSYFTGRNFWKGLFSKQD